MAHPKNTLITGRLSIIWTNLVLKKMTSLDISEVDVSSFDIVFVCGLTRIMERLEKKLKAELKPGARIASNAFTFSHWEPLKKENDVYLYKQPIFLLA